MRISDWSSDVCSSDLQFPVLEGNHAPSAGRKNIVEAAEHAVRRRCIQGLAIIVDDPPAIADIVLVSLNQALVDIALIELSVAHECEQDRKSVVEGKSVSVGVDPGVGRTIKKKKEETSR